MDETIKGDIEIIKKNLLEFRDKVEEKTFLVTGGAGFLGSWFCDVLSSLDAKIICVDNMSSGSKNNVKHLLEKENFRIIEKDVCNFITNENLDYIVHMASIASPPLYQEYPIETLDSNILGIRNMLELARKNELQGFLFTSTSEVYGDASVIPSPENYWGNVNTFGPRCMYDEGKRAAEAYCYSYYQKFHLPIRIARIFNTYGPRLDIKSTSQYGRVVAKFIHQALNNRPLTVYGSGEQTRSFCYITDQMAGLFKLLLTSGLDGEVVNIGSDEETSILNLAKLIIELTDSRSNIVFETLPRNDPKRRKPDINKAEKLLKWRPEFSLKSGLKKTITWTSATLASGF